MSRYGIAPAPAAGAVMLVALLTACGAGPSAADTPLSATVSLRESAVTLGQPVLLDVRWTNGGGKMLNTGVPLSTPEDELDWVAAKLLNSGGRELPPAPDYRPERRGGARVVRSGLLAHETYTTTLVVTRRASIPEPGRYRLIVTVRFPYAVGKDAVHLRSKGEVRTFAHEWSLDLKVTPPNRKRLQEHAAKLVGKVKDKTASVKEKNLAVKVLFSMPESYALPAWRALVGDPDLASYRVGQEVADELLRVGSTTTADLLARMWDRKIGPAQLSLMNLWVAGGPEIKKHVEALFAARGEKMPKLTRPIVPAD